MTNQNELQDNRLYYQRQLLDEININLSYAKAMASVAIGADFHLYEISIIHDYLGGMHFLLEKLNELQQQLLRTFTKEDY